MAPAQDTRAHVPEFGHMCPAMYIATSGLYEKGGHKWLILVPDNTKVVMVMKEIDSCRLVRTSDDATLLLLSRYKLLLALAIYLTNRHRSIQTYSVGIPSNILVQTIIVGLPRNVRYLAEAQTGTGLVWVI